VPHSRIRELAEEAMAMDGVVRLHFGESNLPTPEFIRRAAVEAMNSGYTFYTENAGLPSTRRAIAAHYRRLHGVELDPEREIVVTASGVQALNVAIRSVLDPGDEAVLLTPAWPNPTAIVALSNATPIEVALARSGERYRVDFDALRAALSRRTRLLVYTSPSNPLGWVATEAEQQALLELAREHGLWLVADEVYERLYYRDEPGEPAPSILRKAARSDAVIVTQSFSKSYAMTGWRLGWLVTRADLADRAARLNEFIVSHAPSFTQKAGETALAEGEPWIRQMVADLRANRDFCVDALSRMPGLWVPRPDGAFYLFPRVDGAADSMALCRRILREARVSLAPGAAFGAGGEGSLRLCYAGTRSLLEEAMERLRRFFAGR
jgi:aspartate/methionine/tyrosine aminotransferase